HRAHAFIDLITGAAGAVGKPEVIVVIDQQTFEHGRHAQSKVDCGPGIDLPIDTIRSIAGRARFVPVVVNRDGVVIAQGDPVPTYDQIVQSLTRPVGLDHGRSRRHASIRQRRALRAMYRHCAIPGCARHVSITEAHHIHYWEHGGHTDLANLLPLCRHHHDRLHAEQWQLTMGTDRAITVRARDGTLLMTTGPPREQWE
ncbi:MAG: HNH endonuclease, partial [Actinobacteria bacterium]|nr:HNH endonuclease [Actinomycetota bacterium]